MPACTTAQLTSEFGTDPAALGYATPISRGNDQTVYRLFTQLRSGAAYEQPRGPIASSEILGAFDPTEYSALQTADVERLVVLLNTQQLDPRATNTWTNLNNVFPVGGVTRANLATLAVRQGSRAEVVCGPQPPNPPITLADVSLALDPIRP